MCNRAKIMRSLQKGPNVLMRYWRNRMNQRRHSHRRECLIAIGISWAAMLGCSQDGTSITTSVACTAPVIEPPELMLGLVGPPDVSGDGKGSWVTLKWDASSNALGYRLYIGTRSRSYQQAEDVGPLTTSMAGNFAGDMTYYFVVTAYNAAGESCPSNEASIHIL